MNLKIVGCPDERFKIYIIKAVEFFSSVLITKRMEKNIFITIKFDENLKNFGTASIVGVNKFGKARNFEIELHPDIGNKYILSTLAHEMVHIKQFAYGHTNAMLSKWHGQPIDSDVVDYWDHPWEREAHGREAELLYKFNLKEKLWEVFSDFTDPANFKIKKRKIMWKHPLPDEKKPI